MKVRDHDARRPKTDTLKATRRRGALSVAVTCALLALNTHALHAAAAEAGAATYPDGPIRLIDPYPPGGGSGLVARLVGQKLTEAWGKQVIVDNRPGAAAAIGTEIAAKATPDGRTLVMGTSGSMAMNPNMYSKLPYDPLRDFAPITQTTMQPMLVVLHPSVAANSIKELVELATAQPGKVNFSSSSTGGSGHLAGELFKALAKVDMTHVPYKGSGPATLAVISGEVQLSFNNILASLPHVNSGKLKAIAVTGAKRSGSLPQVPTVAEAGVPGYAATSWNGVLAPAATPRAVVAKLNAEIVRILRTPEVRDRLVSMGAEPVGSSPAEFRAFVADEIARWGKVIRDNNIKAD